MMNTKPDIAVIYKDGDSNHLLFLECKFESGEDVYEGGFRQSEIQNLTAKFLCKTYLKGVKAEPAVIVKFVREAQENYNEIPKKRLFILTRRYSATNEHLCNERYSRLL